MGTQERRKREREFRRNQILEAAKEIFLSKGFRAATMEEIAREVELSPGTLYTYFKNKEELYIVLNLLGLQYLHRQIQKVHQNKKLSAEDKILKFKDAMYQTFRHDPLLLRVIFHVQLEDSLLTLNKKLLEQLNDLSKSIMDIFVDTYEDGVEKGTFREDRGIILADIMWGTFTGLVLWEEAKRKINPGKKFLKPTLDKAFEIFSRGIQISSGGTRAIAE